MVLTVCSSCLDSRKASHLLSILELGHSREEDAGFSFAVISFLRQRLISCSWSHSCSVAGAGLNYWSPCLHLLNDRIPGVCGSKHTIKNNVSFLFLDFHVLSAKTLDLTWGNYYSADLLIFDIDCVFTRLYVCPGKGDSPGTLSSTGAQPAATMFFMWSHIYHHSFWMFLFWKKDLVSTLVNAVSFMFLGGRTGYFINLACRSLHARYTSDSSKSVMKKINFYYVNIFTQSYIYIHTCPSLNPSAFE